VSNPYLSQVERGLRRPSADILQQIAKGLRISAEALYVQAGFLEDRPPSSAARDALLSDADLSERQKQMLIEIYDSFRKENALALAADQADELEEQAEEEEPPDPEAMVWPENLTPAALEAAPPEPPADPAAGGQAGQDAADRGPAPDGSAGGLDDVPDGLRSWKAR
jgi:transcriptional regulator with XRE-family HTH domain